MNPNAVGLAGNSLISEKKLSHRLRDKIDDKHNQVRETKFINNLIARNVSKEIYKLYLIDLYNIYDTMEKALWENASINCVGPLLIPELFRAEKIKMDLEALKADDLSPTMSGKRYVEHLNKIKEESPHLLIAHIYSRYLGDLFGGQTIGPIVGGLFGEVVTSFYNFNELVDQGMARTPQAYVRTFREILNDLPLNPREAEEVIHEAGIAFDLTYACLNELG